MHALVILAPGFEEIEAITVIDILRRAGNTVVTAGTVDGPITASRETKHLADKALGEALDQTYDVVILPGGNDGTANLAASPLVEKLLRDQLTAGRWVAAICAAPTVLVKHGLVPEGARIICHPAAQANVPDELLSRDSRVVVEPQLITSLAAGSAMEFAYAIVRKFNGAEALVSVEKGVCAGI